MVWLDELVDQKLATRPRTHRIDGVAGRLRCEVRLTLAERVETYVEKEVFREWVVALAVVYELVSAKDAYISMPCVGIARGSPGK